MPWTPHDLPYLVERSRREYDSIATQWDRWAGDDIPGAADYKERAVLSASLLASAPLEWLEQDFCELVTTMAPDVPEWTPAACMPGELGLAAFHKPVLHAPYEHATESTTTDVPVRALSWDATAEVVRVSAWAWASDIPRDYRSPLRAHLDLEALMSITLPLDATLAGGEDYQARVFGTDDAEPYRDRATALQATVGSLWLLMTQPRITVEGPPVVVPVRQHMATGQRVKTPVSVTVRTLVSPPRQKSSGGSSGRTATSRWWVRGHWRQQPWGPGRAYRKPVYIAPHLAGNKDAPVDDRPHVQVWRNK